MVKIKITQSALMQVYAWKSEANRQEAQAFRQMVDDARVVARAQGRPIDVYPDAFGLVTEFIVPDHIPDLQALLAAGVSAKQPLMLVPGSPSVSANGVSATDSGQAGEC